MILKKKKKFSFLSQNRFIDFFFMLFLRYVSKKDSFLKFVFNPPVSSYRNFTQNKILFWVKKIFGQNNKILFWVKIKTLRYAIHKFLILKKKKKKIIII